MTNAQIKAELRRSACEDKIPWAYGGLADFADSYAWEFRQKKNGLAICQMTIAELSSY